MAGRAVGWTAPSGPTKEENIAKMSRGDETMLRRRWTTMAPRGALLRTIVRERPRMPFIVNEGANSSISARSPVIEVSAAQAALDVMATGPGHGHWQGFASQQRLERKTGARGLEGEISLFGGLRKEVETIGRFNPAGLHRQC